MANFIFRQTAECADCGNCNNLCDLIVPPSPDFYCSVIGAGRVGGAPPVYVFINELVGDITPQVYNSFVGGSDPAVPVVNNAVYKTMETTIIGTGPYGPGGATVTVTVFQRFRWHPVMGDMYWAYESQTTVPYPDPNDYTYEWKVLDDGTVTFNDSAGFRNTRPVPIGVDNGPDSVVTLSASNYFSASSLQTMQIVLSDGVNMDDAFGRAQTACDQIDIRDNNVTIPVEANPILAQVLSSNLSSSDGLPAGTVPLRSIDVVRVPARRPGGITMVTNYSVAVGIELYYSQRSSAVVMNRAFYGTGPQGCGCVDDTFGVFALGPMVTAMVSKVKFAWRTPAFCFYSLKYQTCQTYAQPNFGGTNPCGPLQCTADHYDSTSLKWVVYPQSLWPQDPNAKFCDRALDYVDRAAKVTCATYGVGDGNRIGNVTDLPQPCVSEVGGAATGNGAPCSGPIWYYDYTSCPRMGVMYFVGCTCGVNCGCTDFYETDIDVPPRVATPPGYV